MGYKEFMENVIKEIGICPIFGGLYIVFFKAKYNFATIYKTAVSFNNDECVWMKIINFLPR